MVTCVWVHNPCHVIKIQRADSPSLRNWIDCPLLAGGHQRKRMTNMISSASVLDQCGPMCHPNNQYFASWRVVVAISVK